MDLQTDAKRLMRLDLLEDILTGKTEFSQRRAVSELAIILRELNEPVIHTSDSLYRAIIARNGSQFLDIFPPQRVSYLLNESGLQAQLEPFDYQKVTDAARKNPALFYGSERIQEEFGVSYAMARKAHELVYGMSEGQSLPRFCRMAMKSGMSAQCISEQLGYDSDHVLMLADQRVKKPASPKAYALQKKQKAA